MSAAALATAQGGASAGEAQQRQASLPAAGQQAASEAVAGVTPGFHEMRHSLSQSGGAPGADASAAEATTVDEGSPHCMPCANMQPVVDLVQLALLGRH